MKLHAVVPRTVPLWHASHGSEKRGLKIAVASGGACTCIAHVRTSHSAHKSRREGGPKNGETAAGQ
jgi:hypothetical protein